MKEYTLRSGIGLSGATKKKTLGEKDMSRSKSLPWWKPFFEELKTHFNAPFESYWEKTTGLHWKDWGKL